MRCVWLFLLSLSLLVLVASIESPTRPHSILNLDLLDLELESEQVRRGLFTQFAWSMQRSYALQRSFDLNEFELRYQVFSHNLDVIVQHNKLAQAGAHTFTLGLTKWADYTNEEYRRFLNYRPGQLSALVDSNNKNNTRSPLLIRRPQDLPASIDWRQQGVVTPVKDQQQCGACWTFSSTGSMEGAWAYNNNQLLSFSEQELLDCVDNGQDDCNTGGDVHNGFNYVIANGAMLESDYPYTAKSGGGCKYDQSKVVAHFTASQDITSGDENALQNAIVTYPGVSVAIDASSEQFQLYTAGVFNLNTCKNGMNDLDHAVFLVGYGTDPTGGDYWIVKNSWNTDWGIAGYIWMARNANNMCGIATEPVVITI